MGLKGSFYPLSAPNMEYLSVIGFSLCAKSFGAISVIRVENHVRYPHEFFLDIRYLHAKQPTFAIHKTCTLAGQYVSSFRMKYLNRGCILLIGGGGGGGVRLPGK